MLVLGLSGSLRAASYNSALLRAAAAELPAGDRFVVFGRLAEIPPYNEDRDKGGETPEPVLALRAAIAAADAVLVATPEYNGSVPGQLKNALDWASRPFPANSLRGKPTAVIGASTGLFGALWAQAEARKVLTTIGARVLDMELSVGQAHEAFGPHGGLVDEDKRRRLAELLAGLRRMVSSPGASASPRPGRVA